jgi:hypothetical protein
MEGNSVPALADVSDSHSAFGGIPGDVLAVDLKWAWDQNS